MPWEIVIQPSLYPWFRYERKLVRIRIPDENLMGRNLQYRVYDKDLDGVITVLAEKDGSAAADDSSIAEMLFLITDYATFIAGKHYHELWDRTNQNVLGSGSVTLLDALPETLP